VLLGFQSSATLATHDDPRQKGVANGRLCLEMQGLGNALECEITKKTYHKED